MEDIKKKKKKKKKHKNLFLKILVYFMALLMIASTILGFVAYL